MLSKLLKVNDPAEWSLLPYAKVYDIFTAQCSSESMLNVSSPVSDAAAGDALWTSSPLNVFNMQPNG